LARTEVYASHPLECQRSFRDDLLMQYFSTSEGVVMITFSLWSLSPAINSSLRVTTTSHIQKGTDRVSVGRSDDGVQIRTDHIAIDCDSHHDGHCLTALER
jgi:hypothetical protein